MMSTPMETITDHPVIESAGFYWRERDDLRALICAPLETDGFTNAFSTRLGGVSPFPRDALNLAGFNEDDAEDIHERVSVFASWVGRDEEPLTPLQQRVQEAVAALVPREREVVSMRYGLEGQVLTCLDLAQRMGTTEKAIEGVGYRARRRLRKTLGAGGESDQQEVGA